MRKIKQYLERWGWHAALLPVFFVLHNYEQYYGLVSFPVACKVLFYFLLATSVIAFALWSITKKVNASLQLTTLTVFLFLFFGNIKNFLSQINGFLLSRYTFLLPALFLLAFLLTKRILNKKSFLKANLLQNVLVLLLLFIDFVNIYVSKSSITDKHRLASEQATLVKQALSTSERPDVYYLIFDCYPGTTYLKQYMQFDNHAMDSSLRQEGFYVVESPRSNYNRTAFSMAATLNFQYLKGIQNNARIISKEYSQALLTINESNVVKIFKNNGYKFYNLSIFDISHTSPLYKEHFLTMPEEDIIRYNTLWECLKRDILWNFTSGRYSNHLLKKLLNIKKSNLAEQLKKRAFNQQLTDTLEKIPLIVPSQPKFVYAHFLMPHPPFFYNAKGEKNDVRAVSDVKSFTNKALFLAYLQYTNTIIDKIYRHINYASNHKAVIIIGSDHGFTDFAGGPEEKELQFTNYAAYYFPDQNYASLYDTLSNINTFPILFNKYFKTAIPLQKDSTIFLSN